jgi:tetratricopeptide (TPR) repeat protein
MTVLERGNITIHTENIFPIIKPIIKKSLYTDKDNKTLSVADNGIGMTAEEIKKYINNFTSLAIAYSIFTIGFWGIISTTYPLKGLSTPQTAQQVQQSSPLLEFRRQKQGTESQFAAEYQTLRQLQIEREELLKTGNTAAIDKNRVALEKSYRAIANLFESVNLDSSCILDAYNECDRALQNYSQDTLAYLYRALAYDELENYDAATRDYQQILQIAPKNTFPPEIQNLLQDTEDDPTFKLIENELFARAYYVRGVARYKLEDLQGAIADLDRSIELASYYTFAYQMRGVVREALQDEQGATEDFQKVAELRGSQLNWMVEISNLPPSPLEEIYRRRK